MSSFIEWFSLVGTVTVGCILVFLLQVLISPQLIAGSLSEPTLQSCNGGKQWVLYDCQPNPITGFGCIVPGTGGKSITKKRIAIQNPTCNLESENGKRVISFVWKARGEVGICKSDSQNCCNYHGNCTSQVTFDCVRTDQPEGGENQCTPAYLPMPYPEYDPQNIVPVTQYVPCRSNFC